MANITTYRPNSDIVKIRFRNSYYVHMKKNFAPIFIVVIIVLAIFIVYALIQCTAADGCFTPRRPSSGSNSAPIPGQTSNWKTYTGNEFSFQYPSSWQDAIYTQLSTKSQIIIVDGKEEKDSIAKLEITIGSYYNQALQRSSTFDEYLKNQDFPIEALTTGEFSSGDWAGYRHTYVLHGSGYFITQLDMVRKESPTYILSISYRHSGDPDEYKSEMPSTLSKILSTFEFTDILETGPETFCSSNSDCWCRGFNGAKFTNEKVPGQCDLKKNLCAQCKYM